ncbi:unnamed protein product [Ilex paraguariensis]|uniref:Structure-specific endonuclease subunit SLX1 homolog n=1 Tax=Ilex paraguariensis TaxID=185542 RepID=A0ABC8TCJ6_9AQUA
MGRRKGTENLETIIRRGGQKDEERVGEVEEVGGEKEKGGRFFSCYLLTSLSPRHTRSTYIGFTVNPRRRIRQHNGEIRSGAGRTKNKRPWEMVLCIYGFPTHVAALQFEWAWQHPVESLAVRKAAATFKSLSGLTNKIKLAYTMLTLPAWQSLKLTFNFFTTKYQKHTAGCPSLPKHMKVQVCSMDELPCYRGSESNDHENGELDDDGECDGTSGFQGYIAEGSSHETNHSSADNHNSIEENTHEQMGWIEENTREQMGWIEENTGEQFGGAEEFGERQARDSSCRSASLRKLFCHSYSPVRAFSSSLARPHSTTATVEDGDMFRLIEESSFELDSPSPIPLTTTIAAEKDQHAIKRSTTSCEAEVIDLFTPSPCYNTSSGSKKRRFSTICPEIIDLTKSPIFV